MSIETYMKCSNRHEVMGMNVHSNIQFSNRDEIGHTITNNVPNYPIFKKIFLNCHDAYWRRFVQKRIKFFSMSCSLPAVNLFKWKTELMLMWDLPDFVEDEAFIVVQCMKCDTICTLVDYFGVEKVIPGMAVFSSEVKECSHCMQDTTFKFLTSSQE